MFGNHPTDKYILLKKEIKKEIWKIFSSEW